MGSGRKVRGEGAEGGENVSKGRGRDRLGYLSGGPRVPSYATGPTTAHRALGRVGFPTILASVDETL